MKPEVKKNAAGIGLFWPQLSIKDDIECTRAIPDPIETHPHFFWNFVNKNFITKEFENLEKKFHNNGISQPNIAVESVLVLNE